MSSARVVLGARCSPDARACRVSRTRARPVLARRASGSSHPPSSISSAPARRVVVVCKEVAAQTAAGLFSVSNLLQGRVDVWCRCVVAGLYLSDDVRADTAVSLVLVPPEETGAGLDPSGGCRVVTVAGDAVEGLAPAEARVAILLQRALQHASLERLPELGRAGTGTRTGTRRDGDENGDGDGDGDEDGDGERGLRRNKSERNAARRREGMARETTGEPWTRARVRSPRPSESLRGVTSDPPAADVPVGHRRRAVRTALAAEVGDDDDGVGIVAGDNGGLGRGSAPR